jgi:hypothetical protein
MLKVAGGPPAERIGPRVGPPAPPEAASLWSTTATRESRPTNANRAPIVAQSHLIPAGPGTRWMRANGTGPIGPPVRTALAPGRRSAEGAAKRETMAGRERIRSFWSCRFPSSKNVSPMDDPQRLATAFGQHTSPFLRPSGLAGNPDACSRRAARDRMPSRPLRLSLLYGDDASRNIVPQADGGPQPPWRRACDGRNARERGPGYSSARPPRAPQLDAIGVHHHLSPRSGTHGRRQPRSSACPPWVGDEQIHLGRAHELGIDDDYFCQSEAERSEKACSTNSRTVNGSPPCRSRKVARLGCLQHQVHAFTNPALKPQSRCASRLPKQPQLLTDPRRGLPRPRA